MHTCHLIRGRGAEATDDTVFRWYNTSLQPTVLIIADPNDGSAWYLSGILEERLHELKADQGILKLTVKPAEIVTISRKSGRRPITV